MAKGIDWNKHAAIAGYGQWAWAAGSIVVTLWFGFRERVQTLSTNAVTGPGQTPTASPVPTAPIMPLWVILTVAFVYAAGIVIAAIFQSKARRATTSPAQASVPLAAEPHQDSDLFGVTIDQYRTENIRLVDDGNNLRAKLAESQRELALRSEERQKAEVIAEQFWKIKDCAREIRTCWPTADFLKRPLLRRSWVPVSGSLPWLTKAVDWYEAFHKLQSLSNKTSQYLEALDFDEVIEYVDTVERTLHGQSASRAISQDSPIVTALRWENNEFEPTTYGFVVCNHSNGTALNIELMPMAVGQYVITADKLDALLKDQGNRFWNTLGGFVTVSNVLAAGMRGIPPNSNGVRLGIPLRVLYEDPKGVRYVSRHEVHVDDHDQITIQFINVEYLTTPQLGMSQRA